MVDVGELVEGLFLKMDESSRCVVNIPIMPEGFECRKLVQSDTLGEISDPYQVGLCVYRRWCEKQIFLYQFRKSLENHFSRTLTNLGNLPTAKNFPLFVGLVDSVKYPASERSAREKGLSIAPAKAWRLREFQRTLNKHFICGDPEPNNFLVDTSNKPVICGDLKPANFLLDGTTYFVGNSAHNSGPENGTDADGFTASDVSSALPQSGTNKKDPAGVLNEFEKENQWWREPPHRQSSWSMKIKNQSQRRVYHLLLLMSSLLATLTFHIALKTSKEFRAEEAYKYNSGPNQFSYLSCWFIAFNSTVFFLSIVLLMRLFQQLPLRPLLQISVLSMVGAYICIIAHSLKPDHTYVGVLA